MNPIYNLSADQVDRFWRKVDKNGPVVIQELGACWLWMPHTLTNGYGAIHIMRQKFRVHRVSWMLENGEIPDGLMVCHKCDVRHCVNPAHLFLGNAKSNFEDMLVKRRASTCIGRWDGYQHISKTHPDKQLRGSNVSTAKLTESQVVSIREAFNSGAKTYRELRTEYGVSHDMIYKIITRRNWTHVP